MDHPASITWMNQIQCLTPFELFHLLTQFFPIEKRDDATSWYPKYCGHYDNSHWKTIKLITQNEGKKIHVNFRDTH